MYDFARDIILRIHALPKVLFLFAFTSSYSTAYAFPDTLWVNSRSSALITGSNLLNGVEYEFEITGTHTKFGPFNWGQGACIGSEPNAIFPSGSNTQVGRDIYFRFGGPSCCVSCPTPPGLGTNSDIRFSIDGTAPSQNFNTLAGPLSYSASHQYVSRVTGQGQPIQIRFFDSNVNDNTGRYRIVVREAVINPIPTLSQWGLIIMGLMLLCFGGIALFNRKMAMPS